MKISATHDGIAATKLIPMADAYFMVAKRGTYV